MLVIGLTGGLGSGKSEAARRFRERGVPVIDADALGHRLLGPGGAAAPEVQALFGEAILSDGIIDRRKLGRLVFADPDARRALNTVVHPGIFEAIQAECAALEAAGHAFALVEAALWGEDGTLPPWMDGLILVSSPEALRLARVMQFRGMSREEALGRMAAQVPPESKRVVAEYVIENVGDIPALEAQVDRLIEVIHGRSKRA